MFIISPVNDREKLKELYSEAALPFSDASYGVISYENDEYAGNCLFSIDGYGMELLSLTYFNDDALMGDTLLRAALSFAANRSVYTCSSVMEQHDKLLRALGFPEKDGVYSSTIPEILSSPCSGCSHAQQ